MSVEEIREVFLIRCMLEGPAARLGVERMSDEVVDRLGALMAGMDEAANQPLDWLPLDRDFHMVIYEAAGCPRLQRMIASLRDDIDRYVRAYLNVQNNIGRSAIMHRRIFQACADRDEPSAERHTFDHLQETGTIFERELNQGTEFQGERQSFSADT